MINQSVQPKEAEGAIMLSTQASAAKGGARVQKLSELMEQTSELVQKFNQLEGNLYKFEDHTFKAIDELSQAQYATNLEIQEMVWNKVSKQKERLEFAKKPFLERAEIVESHKEAKRLQLLSEVNNALELLRRHTKTSVELKEQVLNVEYKHIKKDDDGTEAVTYPQQKLEEKLLDYVGQLEKVLTAIPQLQEKIKEEEQELTTYFNILPPHKKRYRNDITEKGNEIILSAHRLALERDLLIPTLALLPRIKDLSSRISKSEIAISTQKYSYQAGAAKGYSNEEWAGIASYVEKQKICFEEYNEEAMAQEKEFNELRQILVPIDNDHNALQAFFAHNTALAEQNKKNWEDMLAQINKDRAAIRETLVNNWKMLYSGLDKFGTQIAHITDAAERKTFISKTRLTWTTSSVNTHGQVKIQNPTSTS